MSVRDIFGSLMRLGVALKSREVVEEVVTLEDEDELDIEVEGEDEELEDDEELVVVEDSSGPRESRNVVSDSELESPIVRKRKVLSGLSGY